jgi:glutamine synthetase
LLAGVARLASLRNSLSSLDLEQRASVLTEKAIPLMDGIRGMCDAAEVLVASGFWPYPTYCEMLMGK